MLVLARKLNESIVIDGVITVTVLEITRHGTVRLGITAPRHHQVYREELFLEIQAENRSATASPAAAAALAALLTPGLPVAASAPPTAPAG